MTRTSQCALVLAVQLLAGSGTSWALDFRSTFSSIKIHGRPGQVVNRHFQLTLAEDERRTQFKIYVEDWWQSEDGRQSFYRELGTVRRSCGFWVSVNPVETAVEPGGTLDVRVTISIPDNVEPGGFWSVLTVDEVPDPLTNPPGVGVRFVASVSIGIFVFIEPVDLAARITEIRILADEASVQLRNEGNAPLRVEGRFEFIPVGEDDPLAVALIPQRTLLPQPIRTGIFTAKLPDVSVLPAGRYLVRAILDIGLDHYIGVQKEMEIHRQPSLLGKLP